jgi:hypothetical protein
MAEYDNTNRGVLFKNNRKADEKHADYTGTLNIAGVDHWISAWVRESAKGKFFSLSIKPKNGTAERPEQFVKKAQETFPGAQIDLNDEVPF